MREIDRVSLEGVSLCGGGSEEGVEDCRVLSVGEDAWSAVHHDDGLCGLRLAWSFGDGEGARDRPD